jgi:ornithine cyclodeaminase/alanine dehydrogenase
MTLLLSRQDVAGVLTMKEAIDAVEEAFRQFALGKVAMPQRTAIRLADRHGVHLTMPAHIGGELDALAVKVVTVYLDNPVLYKLPTVIGLVLLNDPATGAPLAVMDAGFLTAVRTGAVSGVATKYLARQNASAVGVFGGGVQASTQLEAICAVRKVSSVRIYDVDAGRARSYAEQMQRSLNIPVVAVDQPQKAVTGQDIVILATSATQPVINGNWLEAGQHINAIGSHAPQARELDTTAVVRAKVIPDYADACLVEAGDIIIPIAEGAITRDHLHASLGEIVAGRRPGRENDREITLFKSVGLALQDASVASLVYRKARKAGVGTEFTF